MWRVFEEIFCHHSQHKSIVAYRNSIYRFANKIGQWPPFPIPMNNGLWYFMLLHVFENEAHFVFLFPIYNSIRKRFAIMLHNVLIGRCWSLSTNFIIMLILVVISQRPPHSFTLGSWQFVFHISILRHWTPKIILVVLVSSYNIT
jgi:hypothetical protein